MIEVADGIVMTISDRFVHPIRDRLLKESFNKCINYAEGFSGV